MVSNIIMTCFNDLVTISFFGEKNVGNDVENKRKKNLRNCDFKIDYCCLGVEQEVHKRERKSVGSDTSSSESKSIIKRDFNSKVTSWFI